MKIRTALGAAALATIPAMAQAQQPTLTVYTYDSFVSEWGPGPHIEEGFEESCGCDLQFVSAGDGAEMLSRLRLEGERTDADVVLGLDTTLTAAAMDTGLFAPHGIDAEGLSLPVEWTDETFVPFDWGWFAFVYDTSVVTDPPASFEELIARDDISILIQDPRSSTPGLGLLMWVKAAYGDEAPRIWDGLSDRIVTVTKGWSEAYGLFLDGEADMVLSYTTSPAYHVIAEGDATKKAAPFEEGHYMQIEVAARLAGSDVPELAEAFLAYMLSAEAQGVIPTTNWMYPAALPREDLPEGFGGLIAPETSLLVPSDEVPALRDEALAEWMAALSG